MACCAFALYLLGQLLFPLRWMRDRLFGPPVATASAAVGWAPTAAPIVSIAAPRRWRPALVLLITAEFAGAGVVATAAVAAGPVQTTVAHDARLLAALHGSICSAVKRTFA
jgi:hypothetical protein